MRPKKHRTTGSGDLFRARLDQIINLHRHLRRLFLISAEKIAGKFNPSRIPAMETTRV